MSLRTAAKGAARRTGLPVETCVTLLDAGWTLVEDIKEPTRWVQELAAGQAPEAREPVPRYATGGVVHGDGVALVGSVRLCSHPPFPGGGPASGTSASVVSHVGDAHAIALQLRAERERQWS